MTELNFQQELTGCFGQPVSENPTQVMIEAGLPTSQPRLALPDH